MIKYIKNIQALIVGIFLVGFVSTMGGWVWGESQTAQTQYYNRGVIAFTLGAYDLAVDDFDLSFADYRTRLGADYGGASGIVSAAASSTLSAPASLEQAELAQEHKALAQVKMKQTTPAVLSYKECLRLTSDVYMSQHPILPTVSDPEKARAAFAKIKEDGRDCAINLEILLHQQQQQAEREGKGSGDGKPKDGEMTSEDPGNGAGKDSRNQVND
jgi:hypothetical protein